MGAMRIVAMAALAAGLGVLGAASAFAADSSQPKKAKDDPSRRVCRTIVPIGSRLTTRICKTQEQWDMARDKSQDSVLQHQTNNQSTYQQAGGPR